MKPPRTGLVPVLGLEVVPGLWQLLVALDLTGVEGERLLVRQRKDVAPAGAILEMKDLRDRDAAGRLPELGRRQDRREPLLRPDRGELVADDLLDLPVHAPAERRERPEAGRHLADEARADEQLVADGLGLGRVVAQGRDKEL